MSNTVSERNVSERTAATAVDPVPPFNSFELADLPQLTFNYLQSVPVRVSRVTSELIPGDEGTFSVRVSNGALRLTDWTLHLFASDGAVAKIKAGAGIVIEYRLDGSRNSPRVPDDSLHEELFAFFLQDVAGEPNDVLEPDEVREVRFTYRAMGAGRAQFTAHLHGTVDVDSLFPRGNGVDASADVEVKRAPR